MFEERKAAEDKAFREWWSQLSSERQEAYRHLSVGGDHMEEDEDTSREWYLKKCRRLLDVVDTLIDSEGKKVIPRQLRMHGSTPTLLVDIEGQEKAPGASKDELNEYPGTRINDKEMEGYIKASFETTAFGIKAEKKQLAEGMYSSYYTLELNPTDTNS